MIAINRDTGTLGKNISIGKTLHGQVVHKSGFEPEPQEKRILCSSRDPQGVMPRKPRPLHRARDDSIHGAEATAPHDDAVVGISEPVTFCPVFVNVREDGIIRNRSLPGSVTRKTKIGEPRARAPQLAASSPQG